MANSVGYIYCTVCAVLQNQCLVLIQEVECPYAARQNGCGCLSAGWTSV